uniref:Uncharacterized protein n=1 Tax=Caenorhabditis tropicalis TaxID=1561998 RepID=A0A1I7TKQ3_9PELO
MLSLDLFSSYYCRPPAHTYTGPSHTPFSMGRPLDERTKTQKIWVAGHGEDCAPPTAVSRPSTPSFI